MADEYVMLFGTPIPRNGPSPGPKSQQIRLLGVTIDIQNPPHTDHVAVAPNPLQTGTVAHHELPLPQMADEYVMLFGTPIPRNGPSPGPKSQQIRLLGVTIDVQNPPHTDNVAFAPNPLQTGTAVHHELPLPQVLHHVQQELPPAHQELPPAQESDKAQSRRYDPVAPTVTWEAIGVNPPHQVCLKKKVTRVKIVRRDLGESVDSCE